jgi:hypothetical protein
MLKSLGVPSAATAARLKAPYRAAGLFCFFNSFDDVVEVRPVAGCEFGMEQFAIGANLESAAT